jgi:hypothetical protein
MAKKQETKEQVFDRNVKMKFLSKEEDAREWIEKLQTKDVVGEDKGKKKKCHRCFFSFIDPWWMSIDLHSANQKSE